MQTNVEGPRCDHCRPGTYDLSESHIEGCVECFCSGVSQKCYSSNLFITQIPMQLLGQSHGFTLTDRYPRRLTEKFWNLKLLFILFFFFRTRSRSIKSGFSIDISKNEIGYDYSPNRGESLFWSLPTSFTGNKV